MSSPPAFYRNLNEKSYDGGVELTPILFTKDIPLRSPKWFFAHITASTIVPSSSFIAFPIHFILPSNNVERLSEDIWKTLPFGSCVEQMAKLGSIKTHFKLFVSVVKFIHWEKYFSSKRSRLPAFNALWQVVATHCWIVLSAWGRAGRAPWCRRRAGWL